MNPEERRRAKAAKDRADYDARAPVDEWSAVTCKNCLGARVVLLRDGREVES